MWDEDKINRLAKQIKVNAEADRDEASDLFERCREKMDEMEDCGIDEFTKLISTCATALNQMGVANEKLLKLAGLLQKHAFKVLDIDASDPEGKEAQGSLFNQLKALNKSKKPNA